MPEIKTALPHYVGMTIFQNLSGALLAYFLEKGGLAFPEPPDLKGAVFAICLYIILVYMFMFRQALSKLVNVEIIESKDEIVVAFVANANRTFENAIEQMPLFVSTFFVYTMLVNPIRAATLGFVYSLFLVLYPCLHGSMAVMISTMARYTVIFFMIWATILAAARTHKGGAPAPASSFTMGQGDVYSNSKYLADFQHGMDLEKCKHRCENWHDVCEDVCKEKKECGLSNEVDARHFTREAACKKTCVGFNMHGDDHCTLFSDNLKLLKGGRGQYYDRAGYQSGGN